MTILEMYPPEANLLSIEDSARAIDWSRVSAYLAERGLGLDCDVAPRQFAGGLANINLLVRVDGAWAVLRRPPEGPIPKGAHDMAREHRVLSALAPVFPLAPRSLHYCADPAVAGAPFQLLEYRSGRLVRGDRLDPLPKTPETAAAISRMLIETLVSVHAVDAEAAGLGDLGRPEGFLARTAAGWTRRAEAVLGGQLPAAVRDIAAWLASNLPRQCESPTLLHSDFKLDNLLLHPDRIEPIALLDWDMATRGDPLYDLASLLAYWTQASDPPAMHALRQMPSSSPGFLSRREASELYARLSGRSLDHFHYPRVLASFRLGVVFHQLQALAERNQRLAEHLAGFDPDELFIFALDVAHGKAD